ncbi:MULTISPECIES: aldehyde dehydrogenase family protein [unclassified Clostridium]|uniref:aldehyde dehydrogenase family protein n=1 Tax=unclassified Clostridium TaxID=2614128 RepID=UPI001C8C437F|nr:MULTISPECIES: aldehyde dehydrogenase family protein [unclassified Clostridium]MBX9137111.1 aldehyde dehydrogenase family protein [Clostridium sp. K12(2020)]MBX9143800.1 aldehyde dehydrogenase family protein [Clostridium sp. K13]MDU2288661.1 aldehyde dehydrogenase family protein [Clostridium celatum]
MNDIKSVFNKQKEFFYLGKTNDINFRIDNLRKLKEVIKVNENKILEALNKDLGKSNFESYATEIGIVYDEINVHIKNIKKWARRERKKSSIIYYPSKSYVYKEPYGVTLIIGPFNYPFQLVIAPLIGAISAGNTAIIKPSENTKNISILLEEIINENFEEEYLKVVSPLEGKEAVSYLLEFPFDYIFFTGSVRVGKIIMEKAAKNLTPITLELGGKSPCIVDSDAKLELAAKRIVWGKFLNAGQTCVAPDYLCVHKNIKEKLLKLIISEIHKQFGEEIKTSPDYPRIVNNNSLTRLSNYIKDGEVYYGGSFDDLELYMEPTILVNTDVNSAVMTEEIFGPILPVIEFDNIENIIDFINRREKPLALYYFSESKKNINYILRATTSGGVTINDTIIHVANGNLPFGGVGNSGVGNYHGKASFDTFTHKRSVMKRGTFVEFNIRFAPYKEKINILKKIMK